MYVNIIIYRNKLLSFVWPTLNKEEKKASSLAAGLEPDTFGFQVQVILIFRCTGCNYQITNEFPLKTCFQNSKHLL